MQSTNTIMNTRRYDLDWIRVGAFMLLIFYHIGMMYVPWDWHIASTHKVEALSTPMLLLNAWRLSILFFISGIAVRYAADKYSKAGGGQGFAKTRFWRLFIPLLFGMLVIVPPQTYLQLRMAGLIEPDMLGFYKKYLDLKQAWSVITPTWNHLWYLAYILPYTMLVLLLAPVFNKVQTGKIGRLFSRITKNWLLLIVPLAVFLLYRFTLSIRFETTLDFVNDWANHAISFTLFLMGWFWAKSKVFWASIAKIWKPVAVMAALMIVVLAIAYHDWQAVEDGPKSLLILLQSMRIAYAWFIIIAIFGFGQAYLNRPSKILTYMTQAIFPWYILHQTITVIVGYVLVTKFNFGLGTESALVAIGTIVGCALIHEFIIRRVRILRPLFGLPMGVKPTPVKQPPSLMPAQ